MYAKGPDVAVRALLLEMKRCERYLPGILSSTPLT
jgi:hypothetical protein